MAYHAHARRPNYRNIFLAIIILVLIVVLITLIISAFGKKSPEAASGAGASFIDGGENYRVNVESSSEESSEESSVSSSSSNHLEIPSSSSSSSSSSGSDKPSVTYAAMPETPYVLTEADTAGKEVRQAFDSKGEVDLLFPINSTYYITRNFKPAELVTVDGDYKMDYRAAPHCKEMLAAMRKELGSKIRAFSTYRSYSYQEGNFQRKVNKLLNQGYSKTDAYNTAATIVAIPGTSEHQLGLAIDVYIDSLYNKYGELNDYFEDTDEYKWLQEHACEYGFILSYPKDKVKDTGIIYEPWHYRYVGVEYAKEIRDSGMLLSQWLESKGIIYEYNGK